MTYSTYSMHCHWSRFCLCSLFKFNGIFHFIFFSLNRWTTFDAAHVFFSKIYFILIVFNVCYHLILMKYECLNWHNFCQCDNSPFKSKFIRLLCIFLSYFIECDQSNGIMNKVTAKQKELHTLPLSIVVKNEIVMVRLIQQTHLS